MFGKNITTGRHILQKFWITGLQQVIHRQRSEEAYASVTGTVPMMPDYAMGFWQCKL